MHFFQVSFVSNGEGRLEHMDRRDERDIWLEQGMAQWEVPLLRACYLFLCDGGTVQFYHVSQWHRRTA